LSEQPRQTKKVSAKQLKELPAAERAGRRKAFRVLSRLRRHETLEHALRAEHTTRSTVQKWVGELLETTPQGRISAKALDQVPLGMEVLTVDGVLSLEVPTSQQRTLVSQHWTAIHTYRDSGDAVSLLQLEGQRVAGHVLECNLDAIDEWARRGDLDIEDIYSETV
jgi:hypothetical protein